MLLYLHINCSMACEMCCGLDAIGKAVMDEDVEKEYEVLSIISETLLLFIEGLKKNGRKTDHLSKTYKGMIETAVELKDQL